MNYKEIEKLQCIIALLKSSDGVFNITIGPEECSLIIKYIDYLINRIRG